MRKIFLSFILFVFSFSFSIYADNNDNNVVIDGDGNVHHAGLIEPVGWYNKALLLGKIAKDEELLRDEEIPETYDPRGILFGSNIPSMNQGNCGSCYAFSGANTVFYSELVNYSRQLGGYTDENKKKIDDFVNSQLRSPNVSMKQCTSYACSGGWYDAGFNLYESKGGALLSKVPYTMQAKKCDFLDQKLKINSWGYVSDSSGYAKQNEIKKHIIKYGAVSVALYSSCLSRNESVKKCSTSSYNHAVTLIGWTKNAYIVQNSWDNNINSYYYYNVNGYPYAVAYVVVKDYQDHITPPQPDNSWMNFVKKAGVVCISLIMTLLLVISIKKFHKKD